MPTADIGDAVAIVLTVQDKAMPSQVCAAVTALLRERRGGSYAIRDGGEVERVS